MKPFVARHGVVFTVWESYASSVDDGLRELVVVALEGLRGSLQRVPDLFAALEGWRRVPELIALAPQLAVRHRVVALPFGLLSLQGLVPPQRHYDKGQEGLREKISGVSQRNQSGAAKLILRYGGLKTRGCRIASR